MYHHFKFINVGQRKFSLYTVVPENFQTLAAEGPYKQI